MRNLPNTVLILLGAESTLLVVSKTELADLCMSIWMKRFMLLCYFRNLQSHSYRTKVHELLLFQGKFVQFKSSKRFLCKEHASCVSRNLVVWPRMQNDWFNQWSCDGSFVRLYFVTFTSFPTKRTCLSVYNFNDLSDQCSLELTFDVWLCCRWGGETSSGVYSKPGNGAEHWDPLLPNHLSSAVATTQEDGYIHQRDRVV